MKLLIKIFLIHLFLAPTIGKTQSWIEGRITDPDGEPLAFVSILLKAESEKVLKEQLETLRKELADAMKAVEVESEKRAKAEEDMKKAAITSASEISQL